MGPIWVKLGRVGPLRDAFGWTKKQREMGTVATTVRLLLRGGRNFTGPLWARPDRLVWCAPAAVSGLQLPLAVEVDPSHLAAVLLSLIYGRSFQVRPAS